MDYIYSQINDDLIDINRIKEITLNICSEKDKPIEGLIVGDFYLKVTIIDSDEITYCNLHKINKAIGDSGVINDVQFNFEEETLIFTYSTGKVMIYDMSALCNQLKAKLDKITTPNQLYGTDENGNQTTYSLDDVGTVKDVEVNDVSVVGEDKIAHITLNKEAVGLGNVDNTSDLDKPISTATQEALNSKQDVINNNNKLDSDLVDDSTSSNKFVTSGEKDQISTNARDIDDIQALIPNQASAEDNQLADKDFVNSSIATETANLIGTFANITALNYYTETYPSRITNNDYAFVVNSVVYPDESGLEDWDSFADLDDYNKELLTNFDYAWVINTIGESGEENTYDLYRFDIVNQEWDLRAEDIKKRENLLNTAFNRYKYNAYEESGVVIGWTYEYTLNNSSFTAVQWQAINSGITESKVSEIDDKVNKTLIANKVYGTDSDGNQTTYDKNWVASESVYVSNNKITSSISNGSAGYSVVLGYNAIGDSQSVAIGRLAKANSGCDVAIGYQAKSNGLYNVAIGYNTDAKGQDAIVIGNDSYSTTGGTNQIAMGYQAGTSANNAIAIGNTARANAENAIQLGNGTNNTANSLQYMSTPVVVSNKLAVKSGGTTGQALVKNSDNDYDYKWADVGGDETVYVDATKHSITTSVSNNTNLGNYAISLGTDNSTRANSPNSICIGTQAVVGKDASNTIAIGNYVTGGSGSGGYTGSNNVNIGYGSLIQTCSHDIITIGRNNSMNNGYRDRVISIGNDITNKGSSSIAIGDACESSSNAIAIGKTAKATQSYSTAIGYTAMSDALNSTTIGSLTKIYSGSSNSVAVGYNNNLNGNDTNSIAIGNGNMIPMDSSDVILIGDTNTLNNGYNNVVAIGKSLNMQSGNTIAIGTSITAKNNSIAIGTSVNGSGGYGVAIGSYASIDGNTSKNVAIGYEAVASAFQNAIQLGTGTNNTQNSLQFMSTPVVVGGKIAVKSGGTTGQVLAKKSDANYDYEWVNQSGGGGAGINNISVTESDGKATIEIEDTAGQTHTSNAFDVGSEFLPYELSLGEDSGDENNLYLEWDGDITPEVKYDENTGEVYYETEPADSVKYITEEPTEDNTDGTHKLVLLDYEPSTYYNGYTYYIREVY